MVHGLDAWAEMKEDGQTRPKAAYMPIHMPKNTGAGVVIAALATICGFALIWYIWWLAILSFAAIIVAGIAHTFNYNRDFYIPVETVTETEAARDRQLAQGA